MTIITIAYQYIVSSHTSDFQKLLLLFSFLYTVKTYFVLQHYVNVSNVLSYTDKQARSVLGLLGIQMKHISHGCVPSEGLIDLCGVMHSMPQCSITTVALAFIKEQEIYVSNIHPTGFVTVYHVQNEGYLQYCLLLYCFV